MSSRDRKQRSRIGGGDRERNSDDDDDRRGGGEREAASDNWRDKEQQQHQRQEEGKDNDNNMDNDNDRLGGDKNDRNSSSRGDRKAGSDRKRNRSSHGKKSSSSRHQSKKRGGRRRRSYSSDSSSSSSSSSSDSSGSSDSGSSDSSTDRRHHKKSKKSSNKSTKHHRSRHDKKTSSSSSQSRKKAQKLTHPSTSSSTQQQQQQEANIKLLSKLSKRNETLEEREERRAQRRAARITARFGYTPEDNPFRDPNLHETFSWKKKEEKKMQQQPQQQQVGSKKKNQQPTDDDEAGGTAKTNGSTVSRRDMQDHTFAEIEKVRQRRQARELHLEEMERLRAEESRMKELENYDEWARKEEEFHLQQQRQRSAIRLVEGREKPVDVLAQNMLLFGLSSEEKENRARVKYRERYSALEELETLELNLEEPHLLLKDLKLNELEELLVDIDAFRRLEREAVSASMCGDAGGGAGSGDGQRMGNEEEAKNNAVIRYWDALYTVTLDEIQYLKTGGTSGGHASLVEDIRNMFTGQSVEALLQMKEEIERKLRGGVGEAATPRFDEDGVVDTEYWTTVLDQLKVHMAKMELSEIHSKMLVRQLEKLEVKREELQKKSLAGGGAVDDVKEKASSKYVNVAASAMPLPQGVEPDFGNLEEELGLNDEFDLHIYDAVEGGGAASYAWQDKYRPRKPRYFNRVKTGYDWNAYNKTHYDHDNPPPKIVQGYKFNVFYPDLIDKTKTPQYLLEKADTDDFCILRFSAGPPYEDIAFKIINRQWNKSRKSGFRCTFERGVLSLYFNFASHWYRR